MGPHSEYSLGKWDIAAGEQGGGVGGWKNQWEEISELKQSVTKPTKQNSLLNTGQGIGHHVGVVDEEEAHHLWELGVLIKLT